MVASFLNDKNIEIGLMYKNIVEKSKIRGEKRE